VDHRFNKDDIAWLLQVIRDSSNIRGEDLGQAVDTINKLQQMLKKEKNDVRTK